MKHYTTWFNRLPTLGKVGLVSCVVLIGFFYFSLGVAAVGVIIASSSPREQTPSTSIITTKIENETQPIAFEKTTIEDGNLEKGKTELRTVGVEGVKTITHTIQLNDGVETGRTSSEAITRQPVTEVTAIGTYVTPAAVATGSNCNVNYSGCVPNDSDVDCAGGSGNGPSYVTGPIRVTGTDVYGLDRDGNGVGCE